jgi:hypothetical protein
MVLGEALESSRKSEVREGEGQGMNFLKLFLRGVALIPTVVQSVETLFGTKSGETKKEAALNIVTAAIKIADAIEQKTIVDAPAFSNGLSAVIDGVVTCLNASVWHKA